MEAAYLRKYCFKDIDLITLILPSGDIITINKRGDYYFLIFSLTFLLNEVMTFSHKGEILF